MSDAAARSGSAPQGWADGWIAELRASLRDGPPRDRGASTARLSSLLLACARDDEADDLLLSTELTAARSRDGRTLARVEIAVAEAALVRDDEGLAEARLDALRKSNATLPASIEARLWLVDARLRRVRGLAVAPPPLAPEATLDDATDPDEYSDLVAHLALARIEVDGALALEPAALDAARASVDASGSLRNRTLFELEVASAMVAHGARDTGYARYRSAIATFRDAGLTRDAARAMIRFAEAITEHGEANPTETAASWLGRAQETLGGSGTWRDRIAIATGFRSSGRRAFDRVMTKETVARIEAFERARGALINTLAASAQATFDALTRVEVGSEPGLGAPTVVAGIADVRSAVRGERAKSALAVGAVDESIRDLIEVIGAALFERDRLRLLLSVLGELDLAEDWDSLAPLVARLALPLLDADRVVVAIDRSGRLSSLGEAGTVLPGQHDGWREPAGEAARRSLVRPSDLGRVASRADEARSGSVLAVPLRGRETQGVLYADKHLRRGQFREQDESIAHLLAEYVALAFGRIRARQQEHFALEQLAITLDTIRDGVIACDAAGVIVSFNAAATRMLQLPSGDLRGTPLGSIAILAPLASTLAVNPRLDGTVVRLAHASFVVTTRPMAADEGAPRGFVATLVELDRARQIAQRLSATRARYGFHDIIGQSPSLEAALAMARRAAAIDANVLIHGESGTGKEVVAQAIHSAGSRANEPFIGVNCAAVPRELLEAELFGYESGAFTGARASGNTGKFELAAGGTILLDEIGDMPLDMQAKLLRVLQERVVTRLGGAREIQVHARVIATTHRDLALLVEEGKFRMDLFYRLRVLAFELPALRERPDDIPVLARHYLTRFADQQRKRVRELGPRVLEELTRYDWPGNVRELANVMEAEVSLATPDVDTLERLATRLVGRFRSATNAASSGAWSALPGPASELPPPSVVLPLVEVERKAILGAIERFAGSVSKASEALGVSKVTIYAKLRSWGLHPRDRADDGTDGPPSLRGSSPRLPPSDDGPLSKRGVTKR